MKTAFLVITLAGIAVAETQSGAVLSGGQPIPGATVTAQCGADRIATVTDSAGRFEIGGMPSTPCRFSIGMFGFEPLQRDETPSAAPLNFDLRLQTRATLPDAAPARQATNERQGFPQRPRFANGAGPGRGGFRNLNLVQNPAAPQISGDNEVAPGPLAGTPDAPEEANGASEAFLVNGSLSQGVQSQASDAINLGGPQVGGLGPGGNPFGNGAGFPDAALPTLAAGPPAGGGPGAGGPGAGGGGRGGGGFGGGGFGGGGRGGRGGGPPPNRNLQFGNRINRGRGRQFQGSIFYTVGNSVLNARPYSFTSPLQLNGTGVPKAAYAANRFGFSGGGPLSIPHLFSSDKTFWFVNYTGNRSKNGYDRVTSVPTVLERQGNFSEIGNVSQTGNPIPNIPVNLLNPTAIGLLSYIPLPNAPGLRNNFQLIGATPSNNDNLQARINQNITAKDRLNVNINYQHRDSENVQSFGFIDPTHGYGLSSSLSYARTFSRRLINTLTWNFSRNLNQTLSSFSNGPDIEGDLGITGVSTNPATHGPPTVAFTNFGSLSDATPALTRAQTSSVNDSLIRIKGRQTITYGFGLQRRQTNTLTDPNARGTFSFTGLTTGYDFSDFLLGLPQQTSVARYTDDSRYLRQTTLSAFATDDYRARSNLTINAGLRWEYFAPVTEKYGHMTNLDIAPGFTSVTPVLPGQAGYPNGLIDADFKLFSPRVGVAWKPWAAKQLVVRAGYGIYFNGGVYNQLATSLAGQFAQTTILQTSIQAPLTFEDAFPAIASNAISNTFAVAKNYHPGYAQSWTGSIQESFARSYVVELIYNGTKGTDLDVLQLPNRALPGSPLTAQARLLIPNVSEFTYDSSVGNSIYNSAQVRFTRRYARNASFNVLYTYSKAIDDSSTLGGGPVLIPNDIRAERALSPTDQRHNLRVNYTLQSPVKNTQTGHFASLLRGWTLGGSLTATSGTPFTAIVTGDPSGTAYTGNARAQATGLPVTAGAGFFNPAAFTLPAAGTFGNAGRDTIPGIASFSVNASFFRSFRIDDKRRIEFRIDSSNPINHVNVTSINTVVNSNQYGVPVGAGAMRSVTATVRLRF